MLKCILSSMLRLHHDAKSALGKWIWTFYAVFVLAFLGGTTINQDVVINLSPIRDADPVRMEQVQKKAKEMIEKLYPEEVRY